MKGDIFLPAGWDDDLDDEMEGVPQQPAFSFHQRFGDAFSPDGSPVHSSFPHGPFSSRSNEPYLGDGTPLGGPPDENNRASSLFGSRVPRIQGMTHLTRQQSPPRLAFNFVPTGAAPPPTGNQPAEVRRAGEKFRKEGWFKDHAVMRSCDDHAVSEFCHEDRSIRSDSYESICFFE